MQETTIAHIYPATGGIKDYSENVDKIYKLQGLKVHAYKFTSERMPLPGQFSLYHFEVGINDQELFWLAWKMARKNKILVTIHDPGKVVDNIGCIEVSQSLPRLISLPLKGLRKIINQMLRPPVIWLFFRKKTVFRALLFKEESARTFYLPQPLYYRPSNNRNNVSQTKDIRLGFSGYWSKWKGINELIDSTSRLPDNISLIIAGSTVDKTDPYRQHVLDLVKTHRNIRLSGFIEEDKFKEFIKSIDVFILPYWPEIPGGSSGMVQRIAELGVPIIASRTPALVRQIGEGNAIFVEPKSATSLRVGIDKFIQNPNRYKEIARVRQKTILNEANPANVGRMLTEIITTTLEGAHGGAM